MKNKFDTVICLRIGKTSKTKTSLGEFKITTLENPLLSKQAVTSKRILVPYTNLQLNSYPNTQLNLFCSDSLSFSMHSSQYVNNQLMHGSKYVANTPTWEGCWLQSSSVHSYDEDKEALWSQNHMAYKYSSFFMRKMNYGICLRSQYAWIKPLHQVWWCLK